MDESIRKELQRYVLRVKRDKEDTEAWDYLYLGYRNYLLSIIRKIIYDSNSHQDVLQEVWIKLYRHIEKYDGERIFEHWIGKITTNVCYTWLDKNKGLVLKLTSDNRNDDAKTENLDGERTVRDLQYIDEYREDCQSYDSVNDFVNAICDRELIENALNSITEEKQVLAFKYRFMEDLSIKTIVHILEVPESTLHNWIYRVKNKLQHILKDESKIEKIL